MTQELRKRITLWTATNGETLQRREFVDRVRLSGERSSPAELLTLAMTVTIQAVEPLEGAVAVALVGEAVTEFVALNGSPLVPGLHAIRATEQIDVGSVSYWLSEDLSPIHAVYDPTEHGPETRCCITKSRLREGQEIVICGGRPGRPCNVIYSAGAWDAVIQSNRTMKCPNCGYHPDQPQWTPPFRQPVRSSIHELSKLAREASSQHNAR